MIKSKLSAVLMLVWLAGCLITGVHQVPAAEEPVIPETKQDADESAIRASSAAFAKAFNAGDAKAIVARWTEDGIYVSEAGERYEGREAIQAEYEKFFKQYPGVKIHVKVDKVKMLSPTAAVVEGTATLGTPDSPAPASGRFIAIHVKDNDKWSVALARDMLVEANSNEGRFADFGKFVGSWSCQTGSTKVAMNCSWIADKKYLERRFSVTENGAVTMSGTQVIGWNPVEQQITSWLFDSTGGHAFSIWTPQENGWVQNSTGYSSDGTPTGATNLLTYNDDNTITWKSINRMLGDQPLPDTGELVLKKSATSSREH